MKKSLRRQISFRAAAICFPLEIAEVILPRVQLIDRNLIFLIGISWLKSNCGAFEQNAANKTRC